MPTTTIAIPVEVRERLRTFGHAGMSYAEILQGLMDEVDRERYVAEIHRRADAVTDWVELDKLDWS